MANTRKWPPELRFFDLVEKTDGCWLWKGAGDRYGVFHDGERRVKAHRFSYELVHGSLAEGMKVDHRTTCSKKCVNPDHLRVVTHKQNQENRAGATRRSSSGVRGVFWREAYQNWRVAVTHSHKQYSGGTYTDLVDAERAAIALRNRLFTHNDVDQEAIGA